jgi:TRAP-type C4-dicarboxylate transport system permease small subunit
MGKFLTSLNRLLVYLSCLALLGMSIMISVDVVLRFFFNAPLPASVEISQLIEPWVIFLPFAYTLAIGGHVRVTLITMRISPRWQAVCEIFACGVDFVFFLILGYFSWIEFAHSLSINEIMLAAIRLPWWAGKLAMPIGVFVIAIQCLYQIGCTWNTLAERKSR